MKTLTKKEIKEEIKCTKCAGFNAGYNYSAKVRGFNFETRQDNYCELYEEDEEGKLTFVAYIHSTKDIVNAIFRWFYKYASHEL